MATTAGPTQGAQRHEESVNRWKSHPRAAKALRATILVLPIGSSIAFTAIAGRLFSAEDLGIGRWTWVALIFVLANGLLAILRWATAKLLPLVALMKLTLVFPDNAPSRAKATLRKSNSRTMLRELEDARERGETDGAAGHGDYLVQLLKEVNEHDRLTRGHSERVRSYAEMLGEELKLNDDDMNKLRWSALLHDVGKLSVPSEILNKDGRPTDDEWKILSNHPAAGIEMLEPLRPWLGEWIHSADQHHCRWDGNGYPEKLEGKDISFAGRLVAIADAYDVMTSARSYKKPLDAELARQELTACAGSQFDPALVRAFLQIGLTRLKTVAGPLAWLANLTGSLQLPVPAAGVVTSGAVSAGVASAGIAVASMAGFVPPAEDPAPVLAFEDPAPIVEVVEEVEDLTVEAVSVNGAEGTTIEIVIRASGGAGALEFTVDDPQHGSVTVIRASNPTDTAFVPDAGGGWETTILYDPDPGFAGEDSFTYEVCDSRDICQRHTATIRVVSTNRAPVANEDQAEVDAGERVEIAVLDNDLDPDGDQIRLLDVGVPGSGDAQQIGSSIVYAADADYEGIDEFVYTIADSDDVESTGRVTVSVLSPTTTTTAAPTTTTTTAPRVNVAPVVSGTGRTVLESSPAGTSAFTVNAADIDGDTLVYRIVSGNDSGLFDLDQSGAGTTTGPLDFETQALFTLDVEVSDGTHVMPLSIDVAVRDENETPVAADDLVSTNEDTPVSFSVGGNDFDPDLDALTWQIPATTGGGTTLAATDDDVAYTPPVDFNGADSFTYTITDPDGLVSAPATVTVMVVSVNDSPVASDDSGVGFTMIEDGTLTTANVTTNDTDVDSPIDPTSVSVVADATNGTLTNNNDGTFDYTPDPNHNGSDTFTYTITDADGATSNTATVTLTITPVNDSPVASDDSGVGFTMIEDGTLTTANVTTNDTDVDSPIDPTSVSVVADATNGTLTNNNDGTFDYTPDPNHNGSDTFTYTITDADGTTSNTATVTLTISPDNDSPVLTDPVAPEKRSACR